LVYIDEPNEGLKLKYKIMIYDFLDHMATVCILFVVIGVVIGVPCYLMEWLNNETGFLNPFMRLLYGKDWDQQPDFEDEDEEDE